MAPEPMEEFDAGVTSGATVGRNSDVPMTSTASGPPSSAMTEPLRRSADAGRAGRLLSPRKAFVNMHSKAMSTTVDEKGAFWRFCYALFSSDAWDRTIGLIVILNSISIGAEIDFKDRVPEQVFSVLETTFLAIFCTEVVLKFYIFRCLYIQSVWNVFDIFIVVSGVASLVMDQYVAMSTQSRAVTLFRFTRLIRLVRMIRLTVQFHSVWVIVNGMMNSFYTCTSALIVTVSLLYFFGILAFTILSGDEFKDTLWSPDSTIQDRFGDVRQSMLSLSAFFAIDALSDKGYRLYNAQPLTLIFIVALLILVPIVLMNLITATLVELCMDKTSDADFRRETKRLKFKKLIADLEEIFIQIVSGTNEGIRCVRHTMSEQAVASRIDSRKTAIRKDSWFSNFGVEADRPNAMDELANVRLSVQQVQQFVGDEDCCLVGPAFDALSNLFGEQQGIAAGIHWLLEIWPILDDDDDGLLSMHEFANGIAKMHWMFCEKGCYSGETMLWMRIFKKQQQARASHKDFESKMLKRMDVLCSQVEALANAHAYTQAEPLQQLRSSASTCRLSL